MNTTIPMPEFDQLADIYWRLGVMQSPSQLQGYVLGRLAVGDVIAPEQCTEQLSQYIDAIEAPNKVDAAILLSLYGACQASLSSNDMDLQLLLPDDASDVGLRIDSLGQWCQGFLAGFAQGGKMIQQTVGQQQYPADVSEALSDIAAISQISLGDDDAEEDGREQNFVEISEYLRVISVTIYLECNRPADNNMANETAAGSPTAQLFNKTDKQLH